MWPAGGVEVAHFTEKENKTNSKKYKNQTSQGSQSKTRDIS